MAKPSRVQKQQMAKRGYLTLADAGRHRGYHRNKLDKWRRHGVAGKRLRAVFRFATWWTRDEWVAQLEGKQRAEALP